jgi:hypothetical protein
MLFKIGVQLPTGVQIGFPVFFYVVNFIVIEGIHVGGSVVVTGTITCKLSAHLQICGTL